MAALTQATGPRNLNGRIPANPYTAAMPRLAPLAILLILALLLPLSGCTEAAKARFEANQKRMQRKQAERMLEERAREYWGFARWHSFDETAVYFERSEDQLAFAGIWAGLDRSEGCVELVADDLVNDRIDSPYARAILVRMVGRCGGPDATGILRDRLLNDPDTLVRRRAPAA